MKLRGETHGNWQSKFYLVEWQWVSRNYGGTV